MDPCTALLALDCYMISKTSWSWILVTQNVTVREKKVRGKKTLAGHVVTLTVMVSCGLHIGENHHFSFLFFCSLQSTENHDIASFTL